MPDSQTLRPPTTPVTRTGGFSIASTGQIASIIGQSPSDIELAATGGRGGWPATPGTSNLVRREFASLRWRRIGGPPLRPLGCLALRLARRLRVRVGLQGEAEVGGEFVGRLHANVFAKQERADRRLRDAWLEKVSIDLHNKLAKTGLIAQRKPEAVVETPRLGAFLEAYIDGRTDVKQNTRENLDQARNLLVKHFGADRDLASITPGDADAWRIWMRAKDGAELGDNTTRRHCGRAKQFFRAAVRKRLIAENPFGDMKDTTVKANRERDYFVTVAEANAVLEACPGCELQLIFALARFGGLRCPSEMLGLRWTDIDWERSRMTVRSPKTEHHEGKESRIVPLFPELRPYLNACYFSEGNTSEFVIGRYRGPSVNLRSQLERIITRAGLKPWPKLFQNLRASRATELAAIHPAHVVCEWMGHSDEISREHYLRVTDADYDRAMVAARGAPPVNACTPAPTQATNSDKLSEFHGWQECASVGVENQYPRRESNTRPRD